MTILFWDIDGTLLTTGKAGVPAWEAAVRETTGREFQLGEGYRATTRLDIAQRLLESKEAPVLSFVTALLKGKTAMGDPVQVGPEIADRFIPMAVQDVADVIREEGISHAWRAAPAFFGVGVQTYGEPIPFSTTTPTGRPKIAFRQPPSLGEQAINAVTGRTISNVQPSMHPALQRARQAALQRTMQLDQAKQRVLQTGKPERVGATIVYLKRGIVKTKTAGTRDTPERVWRRLAQ